MNVHRAGGRVVALILSLAVGACSADDGDSKDGLELRFNDEAAAADAGLPAYPGARPYTDADQSSSSANFRLSTSLFGLKVVGMNLETQDKPERVAEFYRRALEKYGNVLECRGGTESRQKSKTGAGGGDELVCEPDDPGTHSVVYKAGVKDNQRIVAIKPHGGGTRFSLVHVDVRDDAER
jgi:hypothetical protein